MIVSVDWVFMSASLGHLLVQQVVQFVGFKQFEPLQVLASSRILGGEEDDSVMDNAEGSGLARLGKAMLVLQMLLYDSTTLRLYDSTSCVKD